MTAIRTPGRGWAYLGAILGGAVSVAANVAHSYVPPDGTQAGWTPHAGAVVGAVFWPVALFVAVEIFARTPWARQVKWAALRWLGLLPVAVVAAVVSYRHLSGLLVFYREDSLTATIGPLAVDGLMVMATGALIATATRTAVTTPQSAPQPTPVMVTEPVPVAVPVVTTGPVPVTDTTADTSGVASPLTEAATGTRTAASVTGKPARPRVVRRPVSAEKVARAAARMPGASIAQIAARAGVSESTARRHLPTPNPVPNDATVASPTPLRPAAAPVQPEPAASAA